MTATYRYRRRRRLGAVLAGATLLAALSACAHPGHDAPAAWRTPSASPPSAPSDATVRVCHAVRDLAAARELVGNEHARQDVTALADEPLVDYQVRQAVLTRLYAGASPPSSETVDVDVAIVVVACDGAGVTS